MHMQNVSVPMNDIDFSRPILKNTTIHLIGIINTPNDVF